MSNNHTLNHDAIPLGMGCPGCCEEAVEAERERLLRGFGRITGVHSREHGDLVPVVSVLALIIPSSKSGKKR